MLIECTLIEADDSCLLQERRAQQQQKPLGEKSWQGQTEKMHTCNDVRSSDLLALLKWHPITLQNGLK